MKNLNVYEKICLGLFCLSMVASGLSACARRPGRIGPQGAQGQQGEAGLNGLPGTNGSVVTPVQFCPGSSVYPTSLPEIGWKMNGKLYAVFSANGGYLFEVVPGTYQSNAIGNSCSFTVHADLTITN